MIFSIDQPDSCSPCCCCAWLRRGFTK